MQNRAPAATSMQPTRCLLMIVLTGSGMHALPLARHGRRGVQRMASLRSLTRCRAADDDAKAADEAIKAFSQYNVGDWTSRVSMYDHDGMRIGKPAEYMVSYRISNDGQSVRQTLTTVDGVDSASAVDLPLCGMTGALDVDVDGSYSRDFRVLDGDVAPPLPSSSQTTDNP